MLGHLRQFFSVLDSSLSQKQEGTIELCKLFLEEIEDETLLSSLMHDSDLDGREVIDLIKFHPDLLLKIRTLIEREW